MKSSKEQGGRSRISQAAHQPIGGVRATPLSRAELECRASNQAQNMPAWAAANPQRSAIYCIALNGAVYTLWAGLHCVLSLTHSQERGRYCTPAS
jgi:hypothetical protein